MILLLPKWGLDKEGATLKEFQNDIDKFIEWLKNKEKLIDTEILKELTAELKEIFKKKSNERYQTLEHAPSATSTSKERDIESVESKNVSEKSLQNILNDFGVHVKENGLQTLEKILKKIPQNNQLTQRFNKEDITKIVESFYDYIKEEVGNIL